MFKGIKDFKVSISSIKDFNVLHIGRFARACMMGRGLVAYPRHVIRGFGLLLGEGAGWLPKDDNLSHPFRPGEVHAKTLIW